MHRWHTERSTSVLLFFTEGTLIQETSLLAFFPKTDQRYNKYWHKLMKVIMISCTVQLSVVIVIKSFKSDVDVFCPSQWSISELACYTYSLVAVPLYDTLGLQAIGYIIDKGTIKDTSRQPPDTNCRASTVLQIKDPDAKWLI